MKFLKQGVFVYVPKLEEDVIRGILMLLEDLKRNKDNLNVKFISVLRDLEKTGKDAYDKFVRENSIQTLDEKVHGDILPDIQYVTINESQDPLPYHTGSTVAIFFKAEPSDQDPSTSSG